MIENSSKILQEVTVDSKKLKSVLKRKSLTRHSYGFYYVLGVVRIVILATVGVFRLSKSGIVSDQKWKNVDEVLLLQLSVKKLRFCGGKLKIVKQMTT
jgi:hypothetical protein